MICGDQVYDGTRALGTKLLRVREKKAADLDLVAREFRASLSVHIGL